MAAIASVLTARRTVAVLAALAVCVAYLVIPAEARAHLDDDIPGVPMSRSVADVVHVTLDKHDFYRVYLLDDERLYFTLTEGNEAGSDLDLNVWDTSSTSRTSGHVIAGIAGGGNPHHLEFVAPSEGWYYVHVVAHTGAGPYTLTFTRGWPAPIPTAVPERIAGSDRYTTAVEFAREAFPGWANCDHVIIASGEDRAAADPLAASGLTWTYGAPILLVQQDRVPSSVLSALDQIAAANDGVTVHIVGGPASVPPELLADIAARVGTVAFDRIEPNDDRFVLAASIARRMSTERLGGFHRMPGFGQFALIANGADPDKFFDALALSPLTARTGYPILLVEEDRVPSATRDVLADLAIPHRVIGGGPATVSEGVAAELAVGAAEPPRRWWGPDRYYTAVQIARWGEIAPMPWTASHSVGVTAKLPDALAGGALMGLRGSPVVLTQTDRVPAVTGDYLHTHTASIETCYVLGGPASVTGPTTAQIGGALEP